MAASSHRWLHEQLPQWEREGLVTAENAEALRRRHAVDDSQPGLAQILMGTLGALLIGTGVIAVIGYNWDDFGRPVRLLFAFFPLLGSQLFSLWVLRRGDAATAWVRETAALLQTMAVGAAIALVSQIYHLGGAWPDFLLGWALLSLPLVWLLNASAVALFYLGAIAIWAVHQCEHGSVWHDSAMLYPLLLLGVLPFWPGWRFDKPLSLTLRWAMTLSSGYGLSAAAYEAVRLHFGSTWSGDGESFIWLMVMTVTLLTLVPLRSSALAAPARHKPQVVLGFLFLIGFGMLMTFQEPAEEFVRHLGKVVKIPWAWALLAGNAVFVSLALWQKRWALLLVVAIAAMPTLSLLPGHAVAPLTPWLMMAYLFSAGLGLILLEFAGKRGAPRLGAALISLLILARMMESELSLLAKGVAFILIGVAFLVFNLVLGRRRRPAAS